MKDEDFPKKGFRIIEEDERVEPQITPGKSPTAGVTFLRKIIRERYKKYPVHPVCRDCVKKCKQVMTPGLTKLICYVKVRIEK